MEDLESAEETVIEKCRLIINQVREYEERWDKVTPMRVRNDIGGSIGEIKRKGYEKEKINVVLAQLFEKIRPELEQLILAEANIEGDIKAALLEMHKLAEYGEYFEQRKREKFLSEADRSRVLEAKTIAETLLEITDRERAVAQAVEKVNREIQRLLKKQEEEL